MSFFLSFFLFFADSMGVFLHSAGTARAQHPMVI